jgi:P4 family phage/plasmid primase-like protien
MVAVDVVLALAKRGVHIFRCGVKTKEPSVPHGVKEATTDEAQIRAWWNELPDANYGISAAANNFVIVDIDPRNGGAESFRKLAAQVPDPTWETVRVKSGGIDEHKRRGMHFYYSAPTGIELKGKAAAFGPRYPGIDLIAGHKYVVGPESIHPSGYKYEWVKDASLLQREPIPFPKELLEIYQQADASIGAGIAGDKKPFTPPPKVRPGDRYQAVVRIAGQLTYFGYDRKAVIDAVYSQAVASFESKADEAPVTSQVVREQIQKEAAKVWDAYHEQSTRLPGLGTNGHHNGNGTAPTNGVTPGTNGHVPSFGDSALPDGFPANDDGNALRFERDHGAKTRYCHDIGRWIVCNDKWWPFDEKNLVYGLSKHTVRKLLVEGEIVRAEAFRLEEQLGEDDPKVKAQRKFADAVRAFALQSGNNGRIENLLNLSKDLLPILNEDLDSHHHMINVANGTYDSITHALRPHEPKDFLTKCIGIDYKPDAPCPKWAAWVDLVMEEPDKQDQADKVRFLRQAIGYSLTGSTSEQAIFFHFGQGGNGKSTFFEVIRRIAGDYIVNAEASTFEQQKNDRIRADVARLRGARLVTVSEGDRGGRISEGLIKKVTSGGEPLTVEFKHQNPFQFVPEFKIHWSTNTKPVVIGNEHGIWRRIRLIPWNHQFVENSKESMDRIIDEFLLEKEGILAWIIGGIEDYHRENLIRKPPPVVERAVSDYRDEMNILAEFLATETTPAKDGHAEVGQLYVTYKAWAEKAQDIILSKISFGNRLKELGFEQTKTTGGIRQWKGLRLGSEAQPRGQTSIDADADRLTQTGRVERILSAIREAAKAHPDEGADRDEIVGTLVLEGHAKDAVEASIQALLQAGKLWAPRQAKIALL